MGSYFLLYPIMDDGRVVACQIASASYLLSAPGVKATGCSGVVIDGCPPNLPLSEEEIQLELDRRRPGQSDIVTPRKESDCVQILSGLYEGKTTGTPISMLVFNNDQRPEAYAEMKESLGRLTQTIPTRQSSGIGIPKVAEGLPPARRLAGWLPGL